MTGQKASLFSVDVSPSSLLSLTFQDGSTVGVDKQLKYFNKRFWEKHLVNKSDIAMKQQNMLVIHHFDLGLRSSNFPQCWLVLRRLWMACSYESDCLTTFSVLLCCDG